MKRRILAILLSLTMMFTLVPTAMAEGEEVAQIGETKYATLQEAVNAATTENSTVTLLKDVTEDITIPTGKNVTLDLGNSKLTNKSGDTITVELGATLTVTGNGESADEDGSAGTVDNTTHQKADIVNNGTVILNGGWYLRSQETGVDTNTPGNNSYYNILNHGEMTINNDTMVMQKGKFSSLIVNGYYDYAGGSDPRQNYVDGINQAAPKLTINNGGFVGGVNTIKNDDGGELIINGGGFGNEEGCAVMNNNTATINGGRFIATGNYVLYSRHINDTVNTGKLTVTDGQFEGKLAQINDAPIAISGGTFTTDSTAYLAEGYMSPKVGDSYKVGLETDAVAQIGDNKYTTLQDAFQAATKGDTVKLLTDVHTNGTDSGKARLTIGKPITLDLNEHTIYSPDDMGNNNTNFVALYVAADTTLKATTGGIDTGKNGGYAINVYKGAKLTIDGGKYYGGGTAVQVQEGELTIKDGYFDAEAFDNPVYGYNFIINCIDSAYKNSTAKVAIQGGYFAHFDPANNKAEGAGTNFVADGYVSVTSDKFGYDYKVVQKTDTGSIVVKPAVAEPEVNVDKISESDKQAVENAAKSVAVPTLGAAAGDKVAAVNKTEAENLAAKAQGLQNPTLYVQTALKVEPTAYSAENKTLTLDITPQYRIVASTADKADDIRLSGDSKNAQVVQDYQKLTITAPTVVTMELPTGFASANDKLSIKHIKDNGTVEYYTGKVTADGGKLYLTFTTNGFSPFVISSAVASIDGVMYPTLAEAVANVDSGKTIKLETDCAEAVTVSRTVKFTLDKNSHAFTGSIKAGSYTTVTATGTEPVEYTFTYSRPYSGSSSDPTYSVTVDKTVNGSVTVSPKSASKGDTVTVTVEPDSGYVLETLTVTDKNGNELTLKDKGDGKYTFTMPTGKVEVKATFMEDNSMLNFFYDVPNGAYFYEAVKWAVENGITTGVGNDLFAPEQPCTRAQIVTFLWRAAGSPEPKTVSSFTDVSASAYYAKAVAWAVENGVTNGMTETTFAPDATCTRGQSVTFLYRALKGSASGSTNFTDVKSDAFYADAINWAVANNVTNGTSNTTFSPNADCTRAEIVTFLYRAYQGK
ncbi:S-layer homology domain-containing protein [Agathobaculum sp.]|uniref:S-layer homology domain-containing protein n=1 Tax=Agathobaculum sp. TaxID=2048138 RepID=UPI003FD856A7